MEGVSPGGVVVLVAVGAGVVVSPGDGIALCAWHSQAAWMVKPGSVTLVSTHYEQVVCEVLSGTGIRGVVLSAAADGGRCAQWMVTLWAGRPPALSGGW